MKREFANGKMVDLAKMLFDGFDSDGDGSLKAVEVSLGIFDSIPLMYQ